jgi:hypothetical protein
LARASPEGPEAFVFKGERHVPQGGKATSKEEVRPMGSLKLCRADMAMDGSPSGVMSKPMRGGTVEARTRGPWGQYLGEDNARRGSTRGDPVNTGRGERIHRMLFNPRSRMRFA